MRFDARAGMRFIAGIHEFWYRLTDGLIGGNFLGTTMLLLTTTGRETGTRHTTPLVYLEDGDDLVVIASNGGSDRDPQWWLNLKQLPEADVQVGTRRSTVRAEAATGDERTQLWDKVTSRYGLYKRYQMRTAREIPVIKLRRQPTT
jgi:deazaflavin-dependent oxidoreductase (nitroreductase family)